MRYGKKQVDELFKSVIMGATRILKDLGSAIALGRPTQAISQATPLALAAVKNPKYMFEVISNKVPNDIELFNLAPIGSRGIEMGAAGRAEEAEALTYSKTQRGAKKVLSTISDVTSKIRELSLTALTKTDVYVAKKSFAGYYLQYMNEVAKIPTMAKDLETEHQRMNEDRQMALSYAQQSVDKTQGVSTRILQSEFKKNQSGSSYGEIIKNIIMPFNNFSSNTKARTIEDGAKIIYGNNAQKAEAARDLAGTVLETAAYQAINVFLVAGIYRFGIKEVLKKAFDIEDDEEFYDTMSDSFRKYYTYVLRDLTVSGVGPTVEAAGVYVLNRIAYLFSEDAFSDTGKDFFEWLKDEPTFQPSYKPKNTSEFAFYDGLGVYGIPFETFQKSISDISYAVKGKAEAPVSFEKRTEKVGSRTDMYGVTTKEIDLTKEQQRFFLFMGIANGISALSGFQDADIMRAGERLKSNIKRGERIRQFPQKRSSGGRKQGGIKTPKAGTGGLKTGR
jgi:peroxiredoxin